MSPATIISIAQKRTKMRGATTIDVNNELLMVIQDLCRLAKWDWRKKTIDIPLAVNTQVYDLVFWGLNDLESIEAVQLIDPNLNISTVVKMTDHHEQGVVLANTEQGKPKKYFQQFGHPQFPNIFAMIIYPRADNEYGAGGYLKITYWAIPPGPLDPAGVLATVVPLVPAFLHGPLVKGLEAQILRYTLGEDNANYIAAQTEYTTQVKSLLPPV